jgi:hypothetical protein
MLWLVLESSYPSGVFFVAGRITDLRNSGVSIGLKVRS